MQGFQEHYNQVLGKYAQVRLLLKKACTYLPPGYFRSQESMVTHWERFLPEIKQMEL